MKRKVRLLLFLFEDVLMQDIRSFKSDAVITGPLS